MKSIQEKVLETFLLQTKNKGKFASFFKGAPVPAKTGYVKGIYKTSTSIVDGYYVETGPYGIEIFRDKKQDFTWQQVVEKMEELIKQGKYGEEERKVFEGQQMNIFDYPEVLP